MLARFFLSSVIHDTIKQRLRASLLLALSAKQTLAQATHFAREICEDGSWPDLNYDAVSSSVDSPEHLERTLMLAQARRSAPGLIETVLWRALDFWLAHDFQSRDWRCNQITVPRMVGQTALLCENEISGGAWGKVIEILTRSRLAHWVPGVGWQDWSGSDLMGMAYNVVLRGCLENTPSLFDSAFGRIFREIRYAKMGEEGIQSDLSFHAPGALRPESTGLAFTRECAQFIALAYGTPWQISAESFKLFATYLLDAQQWMIHETAESVATGTMPGSAAQRVEGLAVAVGQLAQLGNPPRRQDLTALSHRLLGRGTPLSGHRYFWRSNLCVHRRPAYYACLHLGSGLSVANAALVGSEHHAQSDPQGYLLFTRSRPESEFPFPPEAHRRLPGTTTLEPSSGEQPSHHSGQFAGKRFAGGLSEGEYGMAALRLSGERLSGRKAWFFFDESFVCLGSDIQSHARNAATMTCVDERGLQGPATVWTTRGTVEKLSGENPCISDAIRRVEHDGFIYDFAGSPSVVLRADFGTEAPTAENAAARLSVQIDHGTQAHGNRYAYTVLPIGDDSERYARVAEETSQIEILANSALIQAVRHHALRLIGIVFWEAGVLVLPGGGRVAVNQPCLLLCRQNASGETRLTMSSPTRQPATVHVEYSGKCLCFELPGGSDAGRSVSRQL